MPLIDINNITDLELLELTLQKLGVEYKKVEEFENVLVSRDMVEGCSLNNPVWCNHVYQNTDCCITTEGGIGHADHIFYFLSKKMVLHGGFEW